jgi:hypothetical protein
MSPQEAKKSWQKPELTVLVRSNPQEQVLEGCKARGDHLPTGSRCTVNSCVIQVTS